jgi:hypothetical protein
VDGQRVFKDYLMSQIQKFMTNDTEKAIGFRKRLDFSVLPLPKESLFDQFYLPK